MASLGHVLVFTQFPIKGEVHFADKGMKVLGGVNLLQVNDKTSSIYSENLISGERSSFFLLKFISMCASMMGSFILYFNYRNDTKKTTFLITGSLYKHSLWGKLMKCLSSFPGSVGTFISYCAWYSCSSSDGGWDSPRSLESARCP